MMFPEISKLFLKNFNPIPGVNPIDLGSAAKESLIKPLSAPLNNPSYFLEASVATNLT